MASLHIVLDTKNRHWTKPPIPGVYCAVLDIGDIDYDKEGLKAYAHRLAEMLVEAVCDNAFQEDVSDAS